MINKDPMCVLVVADGHYWRTSNGDVYVDSVFDYSFYKRYLMVFDKVYAIARIQDVQDPPLGKKLASGEDVIFLELPPYKGPWQYMAKYYKITKLARDYSKLCKCGIFRLPGATANIVSKAFIKSKKPFALEIVVDPWEYFSKGTIKSIARPFVRISWTKFVKNMCLKANGVSYVTEFYLQNLYPSYATINGNSKHYFTESYSSVELDDTKFGIPRKHFSKEQYLISHVSNSFSSYGKGHITLMKALAIIIERGFNVNVEFIGDGPLRSEFKNFAKELGIENHIMFLGKLPNGEAVRDVISKSDLFVFPTKAEGLPRVLLEAMAEGLPCISSPASGIPEILSEDYLCNYGDYVSFADKIIELITNSSLMDYESERNINTAKKYSSSKLNYRRREFYKKLKDLAGEL